MMAVVLCCKSSVESGTSEIEYEYGLCDVTAAQSLEMETEKEQE